MSLKENDWPVISITQWIYWLGATLVAASTMIVFLYNTFQTQTQAMENKEDLNRRLIRIEEKIDQILIKTH